MAKIIRVNQIVAVTKNLRKSGKKIVLAGGCFDILHPGHIVFLEKAKKEGDSLLVILENDERVKRLKGINRPIHNQKERALVLSALQSVDYIIMLSDMKNNADYDRLIRKIKPDVIAATAKDPNNVHRLRSARLIGAKFKVVTKVVGPYSTSALLPV